MDPLGTIRVVQPAVSGHRPSYLPVIIEEHIVERLTAALAFSLRVLDDVDPTGKLTLLHPSLLCPVAGTWDGRPWRSDRSQPGHDGTGW